MSDKDVPEDIQADDPAGEADAADQAESAAEADVAAEEADAAAAAIEAADVETAATVEAILFASDKPLSPAKVSEIGELGGARAVRVAVDRLNARYAQAGASFRIVEIAGGYQMQSLPEYADVLARLNKSRTDSRLTQPAMETLAIIAYRQPILRADVEAIRGVACGEVLRGLMEKNLVRIAGRAEEIGRPLLYGTTRHFLEVFGLAGLEDLPNAEQLRMPAEAAKAAAAAAAPAAVSGGTSPATGASAPPAGDASESPAGSENAAAASGEAPAATADETDVTPPAKAPQSSESEAADETESEQEPVPPHRAADDDEITDDDLDENALDDEEDEFDEDDEFEDEEEDEEEEDEEDEDEDEEGD